MSSSSSSSSNASLLSTATVGSDLLASLVVFFVALPLCLGIALASGAPLVSGLVSGVIGGIVVGALSRSHTSVSGPAAGLVAIVLAQISILGSFEAFLLAVALAGVLQVALGLARAGALSSFVPTSVIKGLLAAIGVILILKQIPHVLGHDADPEGDLDFVQPDHENTFSELVSAFSDLHYGTALIGLVSLALLIGWSRSKWLQKSRLPAPLAVVMLGVAGGYAYELLFPEWAIGAAHLVQVPLVASLADFADLRVSPDFSQWTNPAIYTAAVTLAVVASLETLLNLEAIDKLDPEQRTSPPNRELLAQGAGNIVAGLLGGLPVTSVIIRGSVNVHAGAKTKRSAVFHGILLLSTVTLLPATLNRIPLSCLAAILLLTGFRLVHPQLVKKMWMAGRDQFVPFAATVLGIVFTDLLIGLMIGMTVSLAFILRRQFGRPMRRINEKHVAGDLIRIELPDQVSFLNQSAIERLFNGLARGSHVLVDASRSDYIDPDVLAFIQDFREVRAPARKITMNTLGVHEGYESVGQEFSVDLSTRELQDRITPAQVLEILRQGNLRFAAGQRLHRDLVRQVDATAEGQHPLAVVLSCIDSRAPAELLFDMGLGDLFSVRVAGNVLSPQTLGSMEYACRFAGSRLIVVLGHTRCGAVTGAVAGITLDGPDEGPEHGRHLDTILSQIRACVTPEALASFADKTATEKTAFIDEVARLNVLSMVSRLIDESAIIAQLVARERIAVVGAVYDVTNGTIDFLDDHAIGILGPAPETNVDAGANAGSEATPQ